MNRRPKCCSTIKFSDCDPFGHLYNVRYMDYMFDGREEHVAAEYPLLKEAMKSRSANWVISASEIRYVSPALWGERVSIESSVLRATRSGASLEIAMSGQDGLKAVLWSRLVYIDLKKGIVTSHPAQIQSFLEQVIASIEARTLEERVRDLRFATAENDTT
jgi:acyl-CoA thioesterase FadM